MGSFNPINLMFFDTQNVSGANLVKPTVQDNTQSVNVSVQNNGNGNSGNGALSQEQKPPANNFENVQKQPLSNIKILSTVEIEQKANYIKELLNLPRDFETLINMIETGLGNNAAMKAFSRLLVDGKINLSALTSLLSSNSKEAVQKLMMTIMTVSKMGAENVEQLKELISLFKGTLNSTDSAQTVKNLILLYLPWLPLSVRNDMNLDFDIDFFDKIEGTDPDKEEASEIIKIMIQTANFGNVLATLELAKNFEVDILITANESFPEDIVMKKFKNETEVRTNITVDKAKNADIKKAYNQNIQITSSNYVSPKLILAAHSLIKVIIDVDLENSIIKEEDNSSF